MNKYMYFHIKGIHYTNEVTLLSIFVQTYVQVKWSRLHTTQPDLGLSRSLSVRLMYLSQDLSVSDTQRYIFSDSIYTLSNSLSPGPDHPLIHLVCDTETSVFSIFISLYYTPPTLSVFHGPLVLV